MPNKIKYSASGQSNTIKKGNMLIGINNVDYAPTSSTGFWNGITPNYGGYTIYLNKANKGPSIYVASDDAQLIDLTNKISGSSYTTVVQCLNYFSSQSDKVVLNFDYENILTSGMVLNLDPGFSPSYPTSGTTIYDLSSDNNNATLVNGISFNPNGSLFDGGGSLTFDGVDDRVDFYAPGLSGTATVEMWCKIGSDYSNRMFMGWQYYDVYTAGGTIGYNTGNGDVYGISQSTVNSLGIVNEWAHYIFEFRSDVAYTNNKIYVNGVSQTLSQQYSGEASGNRNFNSGYGKIATWGGGGYNMIMECAVFRVYNRSLTQSEITQNYNAQKGRYQNFYANGNFKFLTSGGALQNYSSGTANSTTVLPGYNYSLQIPQTQYTTFTSDVAIQVDPTKKYRVTVKNRTLVKGGPGNDVLSGGHTGFMTLDSSYRFIDLRMCGGIANTTLTRNLVAGDTYAYVSNVNNQWVGPNNLYYFRHFMMYPPSHPEFSKPWEYTRIGYGDVDLYYNEITDIGGGELRFRFADSNNNWVTFPDIGYPTPAGTPVMNGVAGGTYNYVFYPTEGPFGSWSTYDSGVFTGENRNSGLPFRYGTKYILFLHLVNYAVPGGTSPLPIMLFGDITFEEVK
jgi:hypothetical protein